MFAPGLTEDSFPARQMPHAYFLAFDPVCVHQLLMRRCWEMVSPPTAGQVLDNVARRHYEDKLGVCRQSHFMPVGNG